MSVLQDLETDFDSIKSKVEAAVKTGTSEYDKLAANPEVKAVADVLLSVADAELPAGVVSAAGEVFKTILQVGKTLSSAPATATVSASDSGSAAAPVAAPVTAPAPAVNPATTSDPAAAVRNAQ